MKRRIFLVCLLLIFRDCRSTKLLRLFSGNLPAMFVNGNFFLYRIIEKFKFQQLQSNSLHTVFDALTGEPLDPECSYPHLQVDIQALFLLTIVQLTSSGSAI